MLELIARLDISGADTIGLAYTEQTKTSEQKRKERIANAMCCLACVGKPEQRPKCPQCHGSGRRSSPRCVGDRPRYKSSAVDSSSVAMLVAGMPPSHLCAAKVYVTGDDNANIRLLGHLLAALQEYPEEWPNIDDDRKDEMLVALCKLACWELAHPTAAGKEAVRYRRVSVGKTAWFHTWKPRYAHIQSFIVEWLDAAERHMQRRNGHMDLV